MGINDLILLGVLALVLGLAVSKIIIEKKKGVRCIGCNNCPHQCDLKFDKPDQD